MPAAKKAENVLRWESRWKTSQRAFILIGAKWAFAMKMLTENCNNRIFCDAYRMLKLGGMKRYWRLIQGGFRLEINVEEKSRFSVEIFYISSFSSPIYHWKALFKCPDWRITKEKKKNCIFLIRGAKNLNVFLYLSLSFHLKSLIETPRDRFDRSAVAFLILSNYILFCRHDIKFLFRLFGLSSAILALNILGMAEATRQIVIIGDGTVGKTCLLHSYSNESFLEEYVPTMWVFLLSSRKFKFNIVQASRNYAHASCYPHPLHHHQQTVLTHARIKRNLKAHHYSRTTWLDGLSHKQNLIELTWSLELW